MGSRVESYRKRLLAKTNGGPPSLAVSPLTSMVVHEIKNPLGVIRGHAELLLLEHPELEESESLSGIIEGVERIASVMNTVLSLAHRPERSDDTVDLVESVPLAREFLLMAQRPRPTVVMDIPDSLPRARIIPSDLEQVLLNLMVNASHAGGANPRLEVAARHRPDGPTQPQWGPNVASTVPEEEWDDHWRPGEPAVEIEVRDRGNGIGPDVLELLFREQVTTKRRNHGTGLGTLLCRELLKPHGGILWIESHVGRGTTARVVLRVADENDETVEE